jgi:DNA-binding transcriptional regulator WhiA
MKKDKMVFKVTSWGEKYKVAIKEGANIYECLDAIEKLLKAMTFDDETIARGFKRKSNEYNE